MSAASHAFLWRGGGLHAVPVQCLQRRGPTARSESEFKAAVDGLPQMIQCRAASSDGCGPPQTPSRYGEDVWLCCNESVKRSRDPGIVSIMQVER